MTFRHYVFLLLSFFLHFMHGKNLELPLACTIERIELKSLSEKRIRILIEHYTQYSITQRTIEGIQGLTKIGCISSIVYFLYRFTQNKQDAENIKVDSVKRIYNDVIIGTVVVLLTGGLNNATTNIANAWENKVAKNCTLNILRRFLYELRRYSFLIEALKSDTPFISDTEIIIAYNQMITSLEHLIAWEKAHDIDPSKKVIYKSIHSFIYALDEYKSILIAARESHWNDEERKKCIAYTDSFIKPWINLLTPEVPRE